jgi:hypothetical protein
MNAWSKNQKVVSSIVAIILDAPVLVVNANESYIKTSLYIDISGVIFLISCVFHLLSVAQFPSLDQMC